MSWLVILASLAVLGLALGGRFRNDGPDSSAATTAAPAVTTTTSTPAATTPAPSARRTPPQRVARIAITASRGDCWLSARVGSVVGRVLFEGVVRRGRTVRVASRVVWVRFGAGENVTLRVNGRPTPVPQGTVDLTLGRGRQPG